MLAATPHGRPVRRRRRRKPHNDHDSQRVSLFTTWAYDPIAKRAHRHVATFGSEFGNGQTDTINGHTHRVHHLDVMESSEHAHELTEVRAPAGAR